MAKGEISHYYFIPTEIASRAIQLDLSEQAKALAVVLGKKANTLESPAPAIPLDQIETQIRETFGQFGLTPEFSKNDDGLKVILPDYGYIAVYYPNGRQGFEAVPFVYKGQQVSLGMFYTYDKDGYLTEVEQELAFPNGDTRKTASAAIKYDDAIGDRRPVLDIVITDFDQY